MGVIRMSTKSNEQQEVDAHRAHPGDPERDHTIPPDELDPSESPLPEGAQPSQRTFRLSKWVFIFCSLAALIGVIIAAIATHHLESIVYGAALGLVLILVGAMPVLIAYRLRVKDLENLNRDERSRR